MEEIGGNDQYRYVKARRGMWPARGRRDWMFVMLSAGYVSHTTEPKIYMMQLTTNFYGSSQRQSNNATFTLKVSIHSDQATRKRPTGRTNDCLNTKNNKTAQNDIMT